MNRIIRLVTTGAWVLFASLAFAEDEGEPTATLPPGSAPLQVEFGFNLVNITDVNEKEETIDFDGQIYLSWTDPRLIYEPEEYGMSPDWQPGDYSKAPGQVYLTRFAVDEIFPGWWPTITMPNGVGNRGVSNSTIGVYPDGRVIYTDTFFAKAETPMDLRRFPFDTQALEVFFHPLLYQRDEVLLVPSDSLSRTWDENRGLADWYRTAVRVIERPTNLKLLNGGLEEVSEVIVTIEIKRKPWHFLTSIFFPMVLLVALTWCVFWMDDESLSTRVNITFIGILSVVAYYFVFLESIPEASYLTLVDAFILATFIMLSANVALFVVAEQLQHTRQNRLAARVDRVCRWAFPLGYALTTLVLALIFLSV